MWEDLLRASVLLFSFPFLYITMKLIPPCEKTGLVLHGSKILQVGGISMDFKWEIT